MLCLSREKNRGGSCPRRVSAGGKDEGQEMGPSDGGGTGAADVAGRECAATTPPNFGEPSHGRPCLKERHPVPGAKRHHSQKSHTRFATWTFLAMRPHLRNEEPRSCPLPHVRPAGRRNPRALRSLHTVQLLTDVAEQAQAAASFPTVHGMGQLVCSYGAQDFRNLTTYLHIHAHVCTVHTDAHAHQHALTDTAPKCHLLLNGEHSD